MTIKTEEVAHADLVGGGETSLHSHAGGGGGTKRYIQVRSSSNVNIAGEATVPLSIIDLRSSASDFTVSSNEVTILNAGDYRVRAQIQTDDIDTSGGARCATEVRVQKNGSDITGAYHRQYHRETTENTGNHEVLRTFAANDRLRIRVLRLSGSSNIRTIAEGCNLIIEQIS